MAILYTRSNTLYFIAIFILYTSWPYPYSITIAILYGLRFIYSLIFSSQIHTLWNILYEIHFIYRLVFYSFNYYKSYFVSLVILYSRSYTIYPWPYLYSIPILHTHSYTLYSKLYSISIAISILYSYTLGL